MWQKDITEVDSHEAGGKNCSQSFFFFFNWGRPKKNKLPQIQDLKSKLTEQQIKFTASEP